MAQLAVPAATPASNAALQTAHDAPPALHTGSTFPASGAVTTPPDLVRAEGHPNAFVSHSAFAGLQIDREPPGMPPAAQNLAQGPVRDGVVDPSAIAAFVAARASEGTQSPARAGQMNQAEFRALGMPATRVQDPLTAAWSALPQSPVVTEHEAFQAALTHAAPPPTAVPGALAGTPENLWPELPPWPVPYDGVETVRSVLREEAGPSWYV